MSEWMKKCNIMTAEETKQHWQQRAIAAFRESVGGRSFILPVVW